MASYGQKSDKDGVFRFDELTTQRYMLRVQHPEYSGTALRDLTPTREDLVIVLTSPSELWIRVVDSGTGRPLTSYTLRASPRRGAGSSWLSGDVEVSNENGEFRESVGVGSYWLNISAKGYSPVIGHMVQVAAEKPTEPKVFNMKPGVTLKGQVTASDTGMPISNGMVSWYSGQMHGRGGFYRIPDLRRVVTPQGMAPTQDDGSFVLENMPPQVVTVICRSSGYAPWMSNGLNLEKRSEDEPLEITMIPGSSLYGFVRHKGLPFPDANVILQPEKNLISVPSDWSTTTDAEGYYQIDFVSPGSYRLMVNRGYLRSTLSRSYRLSMGVDDTPIDVDLPTGELYVHLIDGAGGTAILPTVSGLQVSLGVIGIGSHPSPLEIVLPDQLTLRYPDGTNTYPFYALPNGTYRIRGQANGYNPAETVRTLGDGATETVDLVLTRTTTP
jgi:hypothetical protein